MAIQPVITLMRKTWHRVSEPSDSRHKGDSAQKVAACRKHQRHRQPFQLGSAPVQWRRRRLPADYLASQRHRKPEESLSHNPFPKYIVFFHYDGPCSSTMARRQPHVTGTRIASPAVHFSASQRAREPALCLSPPVSGVFHIAVAYWIRTTSARRSRQQVCVVTHEHRSVHLPALAHAPHRPTASQQRHHFPTLTTASTASLSPVSPNCMQ